MKIDLQRTPALGICAQCDGTTPVSQFGQCEVCGSDSVVRPFSLAYLLSRKVANDRKFLRIRRKTA